jgi:hypothetical protein
LSRMPLFVGLFYLQLALLSNPNTRLHAPGSSLSFAFVSFSIFFRMNIQGYCYTLTD